MTAHSSIDRRSRVLMGFHVMWAVTLLFLIFWWGTLLNQQSQEIARLEAQLSVPEATISARLEKTERMILGEASFFIVVILLTNGILLYLFMRDQKRAKSIQTFFASMTHELRTPLTSIRLQAETLQEIEDDPKHAPFVSRLLEDVERLEGQVQQSLELARMEGGGELLLQPLPIKNFLLHGIQKSTERLSDRISIQTTLEAATITADPAALTMIFRNALDNALKYTKSSPVLLTVSGSITDSASDRSVNQPTYKLSIQHHNAAVAPEWIQDASTLGTLFLRGSNSQGAGVGLFLISSLMTKMKGHADFKVGPNQEFILELYFEIAKNEEST
jgi:signal transduction histidine kinase